MADLPIKQTLNEQSGLSIQANLDPKILTAKAFPRDQERCLLKILHAATLDEEIAESCYYSLPRAGKLITGPSTRLAEICTSMWGNLQYGSRFISNDGKLVTVEGFCWDLEDNNTCEIQVSRSIRDKNGNIYNADMQAVTIAAASAIAIRNAIFRIIPRIYIEKAFKKATEYVATQGNFIEQRAKVFDSFESSGIKKETILSYFKRQSIDEITPEELVEIRGVRTSIKDGSLKKEQAFMPTIDSIDDDGVVSSSTGSKADQLINNLLKK